MKYTFFIVLAIVFSFNSSSQDLETDKSSEVTTYYFIRHAEKDRSNPSEKNPHLNEEGLKRAENWSNILSKVHFDAIYSTDYFRTKETAQPTADKNNLKLTLYDPDSMDFEDFKRATNGKTVLIVGHSNTIPDFVNVIIGKKKYEHIDDDNNGNLYIVTLMDDKIADEVLTIN
ncbi:MAG: phosphoglycerate mutase family protein [Aquaticitalea sp.]